MLGDSSLLLPEDPTTIVLSGCTFFNNTAVESAGGGISCSPATSAFITNTTFVSNVATLGGACFFGAEIKRSHHAWCAVVPWSHHRERKEGAPACLPAVAHSVMDGSRPMWWSMPSPRPSVG